MLPVANKRQRLRRAARADKICANEASRARHPTAVRVVKILCLAVVILIVASVVTTAIRNVSDGISAAEWATGGGVTASVALVSVAVLVGALQERYSWASRVERTWSAIAHNFVISYAALLVMLLYTVVLLAAFSPGLNLWVVDQAPLMQGLVLVSLGAMAFMFLRRLLSRKRREDLIQRLVDAPLGLLGAPAFLVLAACVALTASSGVLLIGADHGWWEMQASSGEPTDSQVVDSAELANGALSSKLVLWEMLDMVPVIEVPRTLTWEEPLSYDDWGPGLVLLAFKGVAGVALIAAAKSVFDAWAGRETRRTEGPSDPHPFTARSANPR